MKRLFVFVCAALLYGFTQAAYLVNVPRTFVQPNGDTLHCFATGDEFYHYLHDAEGFTIVKNVQTGYFVYADLDEDRLVPTPWIPGRDNPAAAGLRPHLNISAATWQDKRARFLSAVPPRNSQPVRYNQGTLHNLVVFIRFSDDAEFSQPLSQVDAMFNDSSSTEANSMYNYFKHTSYQQLHIISHFFPAPNGDVVVSYQDAHPRAYYLKRSADNPEGYEESDDDFERTQREHELLANATRFVSNQIPANLNWDFNSDGYLDNICFVVKGDVADWSDLLWPHRWALYTEEVYIHNLRVWDYNFQLSDNVWYFSNSTLCHEMTHTLGAPDLYHYSDSTGMNPVGDWDLMATTANVPQQPGAYMKYFYMNWLEDLPLITETGRYTLYPLGGNLRQNLAYKIESENPDEFFVLEYRSQNNYFDRFVPGTGILVYRINSAFEGLGNAQWDGMDQLDEVYVYRPGGTLTDNGQIYGAAFTQMFDHTEFDYTTNPRPFLSDGYVSTLHIAGVHVYTDSATFWYLRPGDTLPVGMVENLETVWTLYPNPATSNFKMEGVELSQLSSVTLYDAMGRKIREWENLFQNDFSVNGCLPGIYFVRAFFRDGRSSIQKLVLQ
ncbi:MAG: M6 family metalloprotease domain-containing protein [Bacteroidales bacterium]|nr:M6 family metalloprotease domain-containing protein [Bacteroidales bacterium]